VGEGNAGALAHGGLKPAVLRDAPVLQRIAYAFGKRIVGFGVAPPK
jgi:hypothetical protein